MNNPLAMLSLPGDLGWSHKFVANFSADLNIGYGVKYRISYGADLSFWGSDGYTPLYYLSGNNKATITNAHQSSNRGTVWQLENVLTWDKTFNKHTINLVAGQSAMQNTGMNLYGALQNLKDINKPFMNNTSAAQSRGEMSASGGPAYEHTLSSYFFRASYNYDERYMAQFTVRRDGSSRFGANNRYATFPSFSLGWNVINEPYFHAPDWLSNLKIRGSWGKNGNDNIGDFTYAAWTASPYNTILGKGETVVNGVQAGSLANPDLKWEESEQTDLGIDLGFFKNALTFSLDYYIKKTNGMIISMPIPNYVGAGAPLGNVGDMENKGLELEASYKWNIGKAKFHAKANASYLKNKLKNLGNTSGFLELGSMQNTGTITRGSNNEPFPYFYGYKTAGIFQTMDEVKAWVNKDGEMLQPKAVPGDVRFVDVDGNGAIDAADRTKIGKDLRFHPQCRVQGLRLHDDVAGHCRQRHLRCHTPYRRATSQPSFLSAQPLDRSRHFQQVPTLRHQRRNQLAEQRPLHHRRFLHQTQEHPAGLHPATVHHQEVLRQQAAPLRSSREPPHPYQVCRLRPRNLIRRQHRSHFAGCRLWCLSSEPHHHRGLQPWILNL